MPTPRPIPADLAAILERVRVTGLTDRAVNEAANLSQGWLTGARQGRYGPDAQGWKLLRAWLGRYEARALPPGVLPAPRAGAALSAPAPVSPEAEAVRAEFVDLVRDATTHRRIGKALERLALELALGKLEPRLADSLESALKARGRSLRDERIERGMAKVAALRILLPAELALLERRRAAVALPPLAPGEKPLPPDEAPERLVADCPTCAGSSVLVVVRPRPPAPSSAPLS